MTFVLTDSKHNYYIIIAYVKLITGLKTNSNEANLIELYVFVYLLNK